MKTLPSDVTAALAASEVVLVLLLKLEFDSGTVALNTSNWHLTWGGTTYQGAGGLGTINPVEDSPGEIKGLSFEISGVAASSISLALDGVDEWQGCPVSIYTALISPSSGQVVDADLLWSGVGDTMSIREDGETCSVQATAESSAVDLLRGVPVTYTNADQQALHPGDRAFEYVNQQADQPVVWPAKEFFQRA